MSSAFTGMGLFGGGGGSTPGWMQALLGGTTALGAVGNVMSDVQRSKQLSYLTNAENNLANLTPAKLASMVASASQPLNAGLVQEVGNQVQGFLGERGLAEAPGIAGAVEAQALGPYEEQNLSQAQQLVLNQLTLPIQYAQSILGGIPGATNLAPLLALWMRSVQNPSGGNTTGSGGYGLDPVLQLLMQNNPASAVPDLSMDFEF